MFLQVENADNSLNSKFGLFKKDNTTISTSGKTAPMLTQGSTYFL